jgi:hypothetical protein
LYENARAYFRDTDNRGNQENHDAHEEGSALDCAVESYASRNDKGNRNCNGSVPHRPPAVCSIGDARDRHCIDSGMEISSEAKIPKHERLGRGGLSDKTHQRDTASHKPYRY